MSYGNTRIWILTLTDIADEAEIHYTTLMKVLPLLEELGLVTMTQQVGNAKLYQINSNDIVVKSCDEVIG